MTAAFAPTTRRHSHHPSLAKPTEFTNEDWFDDAQLKEMRDYVRPLRWVNRASSAVGTLFILVFVFAKLGPKLLDKVDVSGWFWELVIISTVVTIASTIIDLPFSAWVALDYDKRHGVSNQTTGLFAKDTIKNVVLNSVLNAALLGPVYAAIHTFEQWWLIGGLAFLALSLVLAFVYPVLIMPRFNKFTPMPDGELRTRIEQIAEVAETPIEGVYLVDGSKRSRRGNAYVAGFGKTKRVVVYDTIADWPLDEISQVVAHEIGHYRLKHTIRGFPFSGLQMLVVLALTQVVLGNDTILRWAGLKDIGDPASLPLFLLVFGTISSVVSLAGSWNSRRYERAADLEALELLGDPTAFVSLWPKFVELNKADLEPTWWSRLGHSHPEIGERMAFGRDWADLNDVAFMPPEKASVPKVSADDQKAPAALG